MAETITEMGAPGGREGVRASQYDQWLDGQKWRLSEGEDAEVLETLRRALYRRGKTLGVRVRVRVYPTAGVLEVQAQRPGGTR